MFGVRRISHHNPLLGEGLQIHQSHSLRRREWLVDLLRCSIQAALHHTESAASKDTNHQQHILPIASAIAVNQVQEQQQQKDIGSSNRTGPPQAAPVTILEEAKSQKEDGSGTAENASSSSKESRNKTMAKWRYRSKFVDRNSPRIQEARTRFKKLEQINRLRAEQLDKMERELKQKKQMMEQAEVERLKQEAQAKLDAKINEERGRLAAKHQEELDRLRETLTAKSQASLAKLRERKEQANGYWLKMYEFKLRKEMADQLAAERKRLKAEMIQRIGEERQKVQRDTGPKSMAEQLRKRKREIDQDVDRQLAAIKQKYFADRREKEARRKALEKEKKEQEQELTAVKNKLASFTHNRKLIQSRHETVNEAVQMFKTEIMNMTKAALAKAAAEKEETVKRIDRDRLQLEKGLVERNEIDGLKPWEKRVLLRRVNNANSSDHSSSEKPTVNTSDHQQCSSMTNNENPPTERMETADTEDGFDDFEPDVAENKEASKDEEIVCCREETHSETEPDQPTDATS